MVVCGVALVVLHRSAPRGSNRTSFELHIPNGSGVGNGLKRECVVVARGNELLNNLTIFEVALVCRTAYSTDGVVHTIHPRHIEREDIVLSYDNRLFDGLSQVSTDNGSLARYRLAAILDYHITMLPMGKLVGKHLLVLNEGSDIIEGLGYKVSRKSTISQEVVLANRDALNRAVDEITQSIYVLIPT